MCSHADDDVCIMAKNKEREFLIEINLEFIRFSRYQYQAAMYLKCSDAVIFLFFLCDR